MLKILSNSDIVYENERIVRINGIEFKPAKIIIKKNVYNINAPFSPEIIFDKKSVSENGEKHINILKKIKF